MNLIIFSFLVVICCFDNVSGAIQMQKTRAYLKKYTGTSTLPVVPNAEKCGGCGSYSEVRTQGCRISNDMCTIPSGRDVQIEIDYIPAKDARILSLKVDVTVPGNDPEIIFDAPILNSSVRRGGKYTIEIHAAASTALRGEKVKVKYQLIGEDGSLKLCMEAEAWMD